MNSNSTQNDDPYLQSLMGDFLDESGGILRQLNENLLHLEDLLEASTSDTIAPDATLLNEMFRAAHSLKGLSGMLRLDNINGLTHQIESIFNAARGGKLAVSGKVVDVVYRSVGRLEAMIELLSGMEGDAVDCRVELADIESLLKLSDSERPIACQVDIEQELRGAEAMPAAPQTAPVPAAPPPVESKASSDSPLSAVEDDDDIPAKYLGIFIDESELTLAELSATLLAGCDARSNESLLVGCHRLKGSAASIGLQRIARSAHFMEDLLQEKRRTKEPLSVEVADALLKCTDAVRSAVAGIKSGARVDALDEACRQLLEVSQPEASAGAPAASLAPSHQAVDPAELLKKVLALAPDHATGYAGHVIFEPGLALVELKAQVLVDKLQRIGTLFHCHPAEDQLDATAQMHCLTFGIETDAHPEQVSSTLQIEGVVSVEVVPIKEQRQPSVAAESVPNATEEKACDDALAAPVGTATAEPARGADESAARQKTGKSKPTETLRVDIDRLDQLMNLAGQLVINKARFSQIGTRLRGFSAFKTALNTVTIAGTNATRLMPRFKNSRYAARIAYRVAVQRCRAITRRSKRFAGRAGAVVTNADRVERPLGSHSSARSGLRRHANHGNGHADGAHRPAVCPIQPRGARFGSRKRQTGFAEGLGRVDGTG